MLMHVWYYLKCRMSDEKGQGLVEYGLILALVGLVVAGALSTLAVNIGDLFEGLGTKLTNSTSSTST